LLSSYSYSIFIPGLIPFKAYNENSKSTPEQKRFFSSFKTADIIIILLCLPAQRANWLQIQLFDFISDCQQGRIKMIFPDLLQIFLAISRQTAGNLTHSYKPYSNYDKAYL
jgi:hypothetical protein